MATFQKFDVFVENVAEKVHDLGADTLKVALTNTAPVATNTILANITQIANGNGYTTGGTQAVISSSTQTSGTYKLVLADVVFTCITAAMATFQYTVLYNDTPTSPADPLIGFWNYGSGVTLQVGETFTWDADPSTGVLTLA